MLLEKNKSVILFGVIFLALNAYFMLKGNYYFNLLPLVLLMVYSGVFYTEKVFLLVALLTPLSVNLEEFTDGKVGLFIPTEPILFGLMLWILMRHFKESFLPKELVKSPIVWAVGFYLFWIFTSSLTSTHPIVSFKFLLVKFWFIIPVLFYGVYVFRKTKNIKTFLWLFATGMVIVMLYTVINHSLYAFGEKEGHWVMSPFFKDHTIYGAAVALCLFIVMSLLFSKKHDPVTRAVLMSFCIINLIALYFSYTRAAWVSVFAAFLVYLCIRFKIKFKYLLSVGLLLGLVVLLFWDPIQMELARNDQEHTTEDFGERLQSATNVTTDASNLERLNRWDCAIEMFKARPIVGFGPGTYAFEYARFQDPENLTIISTNFGNMGNAHSEYLGPLAEMGLFGLLSMILLVAAIFYQGISLYIKYPKDEVETRRIILFLVLGLVTYFVHGLLNNYLDTDKASVPVWGICAIIIALNRQRKSLEKSSVNP